jgi:hypothetical protein
MLVIGFLGLTSPDAFAPLTAAFERGLSETGFAEARTWQSFIAGRMANLTNCPHSRQILFGSG